ncbi:hypothetical protein ACER0A_002295 [Haloimpatiens sp. FM7315]|uniref:hypothetical protein n=1 Tax=Haloimpatiens sp. FM7315 TaxID=3298609 RepID=UPI00397734CF
MNDYTKIQNFVLFKAGLSSKAIVLYMKLLYLFNLEKNAKIDRMHFKYLSGYGETAFKKAWKELKTKGLVTQTKKRDCGKLTYEYYLKTSPHEEAEIITPLSYTTKKNKTVN